MNELIVLLDLETSGLDANDCVILECGILIANQNFEPIAARSWLVDHDVEWQYLDLAVRNMHSARHPMHGYNYSLMDTLVRARRDGKLLSPEQAANRAIGWLESFGIDSKSHALTGSTISFDRSFLKEHMPDLDNFFDYHSVDVSSISQMMEMFKIRGTLEKPVDRKIHRSIPDCEDSLKKYQWCVDSILEGRTNVQQLSEYSSGTTEGVDIGLVGRTDSGAESVGVDAGTESLQGADGSAE